MSSATGKEAKLEARKASMDHSTWATDGISGVWGSRNARQESRGTGPATRRGKGNKGKKSGRDGTGAFVRLREDGV